MTEDNSRPLHEQQPTTRFSKRVDAYSKYRPDYPREVYDAILEGFDRSSIIVADVGAGTGISSRGLAEAGVRVVAIEPNLQMREAAEPHPSVEYRDAPAEDTGLDADSIDIVTAFQAFHWFNPPRALTEFHRILKSGGPVALVWNLRARDDGFTAAYSDIVNRLATSPAAEERPGVADPLMSSHLFHDAELLTFSHSQLLSLEGLLGRAQSTSYLPREGEGWVGLEKELRRLHETWADGGMVRLAYRTELYRASKR